MKEKQLEPNEIERTPQVMFLVDCLMLHDVTGGDEVSVVQAVLEADQKSIRMY